MLNLKQNKTINRMKFNLLIVLKIADIYLNLHYVVLINYQFLSKLLNYLLMFNLHFSEACQSPRHITKPFGF